MTDLMDPLRYSLANGHPLRIGNGRITRPAQPSHILLRIFLHKAILLTHHHNTRRIPKEALSLDPYLHLTPHFPHLLTQCIIR